MNTNKMLCIITLVLFFITFLLSSHFDWCVAMGI